MSTMQEAFLIYTSPVSRLCYCCYLEIAMEKAIATHSSTLAWKIPWMKEPGRLQSVGSLRVRHDWATSLSCTGEGNGDPLQCSCLENPRDGGAWWAAVYGVAQSQTRLKQLSSSSSSIHLYTPMNWKESFTILKPYQVLLNHRNDQLLIHTSQWVHLTYIQLSEEARLMGDILENKFSEWWCEDIDELTFPLKQQKYRQND